MFRSAVVIAASLSVLTPAALFARDPPTQPPVRAIHVTGAREIATQVILEALHLEVGDPLIDAPAGVAESVSRQYRAEGYTFARVTAAFDEATGELDLDIDEGVIDHVVFQGVDEKLASTFADEFALRAGDVFNSRRARQALELSPTQRYYVHIIATLGTLAEREVDEVGDAVFGRPSEANGLGSLGRLMFRTVLQVSDYLQSVSAEARSRRTAGADLLR